MTGNAERRVAPADAMFAAAASIARQVVPRRTRRQPVVPQPRPVPPVDYSDYEVEDGCRCHLVRMPPCTWCETSEDDR